MLSGHSFASKPGELKIRVQDPLGAPVAGAKVELGDRSMLTNDFGVAIFEKVELKKDFTLKISSENSNFVTKKTSFYLNGQMEVSVQILNWTTAYWETALAEFREEVNAIRQEIFNTTDFSLFAACDDSTGEHHFLEAEFPGGAQMLQYYISASVVYPEESIDMEEQGKVYMSFVIETDGQITNIEVEKGVSRDLDREATRCVREMPSWLPGVCNGNPVRMGASLPIVFTLE